MPTAKTISKTTKLNSTSSISLPKGTHPGFLALWKMLRSLSTRPPDLTLSQWADAHRVLAPESSSEPGRWRTARVPYMREVMDACADPDISEVVVQKGAQLGWTETLGN